jgi:hypothetical protein
MIIYQLTFNPPNAGLPPPDAGLHVPIGGNCDDTVDVPNDPLDNAPNQDGDILYKLAGVWSANNPTMHTPTEWRFYNLEWHNCTGVLSRQVDS